MAAHADRLPGARLGPGLPLPLRREGRERLGLGLKTAALLAA